MKKHYSFILVIAVLITVNTSCVHYYYAPNSNNVPLFKEKNEVRIQAATTTLGNDAAENINGFEMQTAYAFSKKFAAQLNFFSAGSTDAQLGSGKGSYIEMAAGYFKPFYKDHWVFETYAGVGTGGVNSVFLQGGANEQDAKTSITKFFVQPSLGYCRNHFAFAIASKFSYVDLGLKSSSVGKDAFPTDYDVIESFRNGKSFFCWEPSIMIRGGFKQAQLFTQLTFLSKNDQNAPYCNGNFAFGIVVPFAIKAKK
jgi:hypothetical protein